MSNISSINIGVEQLNTAASLCVLILSLISIIPGGIGLIFNILIFTRPILRNEGCVVYFFCSTCFSVFIVLIMQPIRVIAASFNKDLANYNLGICKLQWFALYSTRSIASWLIVFACMDRFFHSSINIKIRQLSSLKTARIIVLISSILIYILYIHMIIYYEIIYGLDRFGNISPSCGAQQGIYRKFFGFWNMIMYSLCPCSLMFIFGLLTLKNIRQYLSIIPVMNDTMRIARRTDIQLLRMLTAQVFITILFTLPTALNDLYASFTSSWIRDTFQIAQLNLLGRVTGIIPYFAHSTTFYLYTLTGSIFRRELFRIFRRCLHSNRIVPPTIPGGTR